MSKERCFRESVCKAASDFPLHILYFTTKIKSKSEYWRVESKNTSMAPFSVRLNQQEEVPLERYYSFAYYKKSHAESLNKRLDGLHSLSYPGGPALDAPKESVANAQAHLFDALVL